MHKDLYRAWKKPGDITDVPALTAQSKEYSTLTSDRFLISSSALALKNVSLNYVVPEVFTKKLGLKGIALGAAAENIFLISARRGMNPYEWIHWCPRSCWVQHRSYLHDLSESNILTRL